jgi:predicted alpha/beta hydrolase family esterase
MEMVILPGYGGSGETHWQTLWERMHPAMRRFQPKDWDAPDLDDWHEALDRAVKGAPSPPLLVAHSLSCLLIAHWQSKSVAAVAGAFMVAVPDGGSSAFPREAASFANSPSTRFRFPSMIVASSNDPYGTVEYARTRAQQWGSSLVEAGALGHINSQSGLGDWAQGLALLEAFRAGQQQNPAISCGTLRNRSSDFG